MGAKGFNTNDMSKSLTVVMYHYVRDIQNTVFPHLKALSIKGFKNQLKYFKKHYNFVGIEEIINSVEDPAESLPPNAIHLTFDDGYVDHYITVLPLLIENKVSASFYPSGLPLQEQKVLDVNKIHFLLGKGISTDIIISEIDNFIKRHKNYNAFISLDRYYNKLQLDSRYDDKKTIFVKRMLQRELPRMLRKEIVGYLFRKHITKDETGFSESLYMSVENLKELESNNCSVGNHTYTHEWLDSLSPKLQKKEIEDIDYVFKENRLKSHVGVISYPYGAYNKDTISTVKNMHYKIGFTVEPKIALIEQNKILYLPRYDTNDFPK